MIARARWLLALLPMLPNTAVVAQKPAPERCQLAVLSSDREGVREEFQAGVNYFLGGDVHLRCRNQPVFLDADSVASLSGSTVQLITRAHYRDVDVDATADTITYTSRTERLELRGNAVVVNRTRGSTLTSPWIDYLRAVKGVRDSAEVTALQRPTVTYKVPRSPTDSVDPSPYVITSDGMRTRGSAWMIGWGTVLVDRDSLHGRGDSIRYVRSTQDLATLVGTPATLHRAGADSFTVSGNEVQLGFVGDEIRQVSAYGDGLVHNRVGKVTGDTVKLDFEAGELVATVSWGTGDPAATVVADGFDVSGDSIAIETPGERLRDLRVFGDGVLMQPTTEPTEAAAVSDSTAVDSLPPIRNTITGGAIHARFVDHDSMGTLVTQLVDIVATGNATSLFMRQVTRNGNTSPTINYTRGDTIVVVMQIGDSAGVAEVRAYRGDRPVDGVQLERASLPKSEPVSAGQPARREGEP